MITGFNTDIVFEGVTYHVQTEDKGLKTPHILSLVYDHGTILASKRSPYNDLLEGEFDEKVLTERLQRQHKLICAAINSGRIDDLKKMTLKESIQTVDPSEIIVEPQIEPPQMETPVSVVNQIGYETLKMPKFFSTDEYEPIEEIRIDDSVVEMIEEESQEFRGIVKQIYEDDVVEPEANPPVLHAIKEEFIIVKKTDIEIDENNEPFEGESKRIPKPAFGLTQTVSTIVAQEPISPVEAVEIVSQNMVKPPIGNRDLWIKLTNEMEFFGGDRKTLNISIHRGNDPTALENAHVIIKILGSSFRPMIFHAKTGPDGLAIVHLQFPSFKTGRAVLLIRALYNGEESEVRHPIGQGGTPVAW